MGLPTGASNPERLALSSSYASHHCAEVDDQGDGANAACVDRDEAGGPERFGIMYQSRVHPHLVFLLSKSHKRTWPLDPAQPTVPNTAGYTPACTQTARSHFTRMAHADITS